MTVGISDHLPQFALIPIAKKPQDQKPDIKKMRNFKNIDTVKFNQDLQSIDWTLQESDDLNQYGTNFINVFNQLLNVHAPEVSTKQTHSNTKRKAKPGSAMKS